MLSKQGNIKVIIPNGNIINSIMGINKTLYIIDNKLTLKKLFIMIGSEDKKQIKESLNNFDSLFPVICFEDRIIKKVTITENK